MVRRVTSSFIHKSHFKHGEQPLRKCSICCPVSCEQLRYRLQLQTVREKLTDISNHFIMDCPKTTAERNKLWDLLQDRLPVTVSAQLFNNDEGLIYTNMFSAWGHYQ